MPIQDDPIKHVVLLQLENHSFDQMLGCLKKDVYPALEGVSEAHFNEDSKGNKFYQTALDYPQMEVDPLHEYENVKEQLSDGNGGFVKNFEKTKGCTDELKQKIMAYYPKGSLPALHYLAENFTVCDNWFSSVPGPTWPNRFFSLTGTTMGFITMPENKQHLEMLMNQTQTTIFDRLNEKNKSWSVFYYDMPCSLILRNQKKAENIKNYYFIDDFFDWCENKKESEFPDFCFIEPKYFGLDQNDDHPPHHIMKAQKLIADVYNALNSNQELFETTLFIIMYDEHGGFYDHAVPPQAIPPDEHTDEYTFNQYGLRVPALLISPYVKQGVDKTLYDHTSVLKYFIEKWDLGDLGKRTAAANSIGIAIQKEKRKYEDLPGFIRVPFSKMISPHPEWEEQSNTQNQKGLGFLWKTLESGTYATGIEAYKEAADIWSKNRTWINFKYFFGTLVVAFGKYLQFQGREELRERNNIKIDPIMLRAIASNEKDKV